MTSRVVRGHHRRQLSVPATRDELSRRDSTPVNSSVDGIVNSVRASLQFNAGPCPFVKIPKTHESRRLACPVARNHSVMISCTVTPLSFRLMNKTPLRDAADGCRAPEVRPTRI